MYQQIMKNLGQQMSFKRTWAQVVRDQGIDSQGASNDSYDQRISHQASINSDVDNNQFWYDIQTVSCHLKANTQHPASQRVLYRQNPSQFQKTYIEPLKTVSEVFDSNNYQLDLIRINQTHIQNNKMPIPKSVSYQMDVQPNEQQNFSSSEQIKLQNISTFLKAQKKTKSDKTYDKSEIQQFQNFYIQSQASMQNK